MKKFYMLVWLLLCAGLVTEAFAAKKDENVQIKSFSNEIAKVNGKIHQYIDDMVSDWYWSNGQAYIVDNQLPDKNLYRNLKIWASDYGINLARPCTNGHYMTYNSDDARKVAEDESHCYLEADTTFKYEGYGRLYFSGIYRDSKGRPQTTRTVLPFLDRYLDASSSSDYEVPVYDTTKAQKAGGAMVAVSSDKIKRLKNQVSANAKKDPSNHRNWGFHMFLYASQYKTSRSGTWTEDSRMHNFHEIVHWDYKIPAFGTAYQLKKKMTNGYDTLTQSTGVTRDSIVPIYFDVFGPDSVRIISQKKTVYCSKAKDRVQGYTTVKDFGIRTFEAHPSHHFKGEWIKAEVTPGVDSIVYYRYAFVTHTHDERVNGKDVPVYDTTYTNEYKITVQQEEPIQAHLWISKALTAAGFMAKVTDTSKSTYSFAYGIDSLVFSAQTKHDEHRTIAFEIEASRSENGKFESIQSYYPLTGELSYDFPLNRSGELKTAIAPLGVRLRRPGTNYSKLRFKVYYDDNKLPKDTVYSKTITINWSYFVKFLAADGSKLSDGYRNSGTANLPNTSVKLPANTHDYHYGYHWLNLSDSTTYPSTTESVKVTDSTTYKVVIDTAFFVKFVGLDGSVIDSQYVVWGEKPTFPKDPEQEGYKFEGWSSDTSKSVTEPTTIKAKYSVLVQFIGLDGSVIDSQYVVWGEKPTFPKDPEQEGYKFEGWSSDTSKSVTEPTTIKAIFKKLEEQETGILAHGIQPQVTIATAGHEIQIAGARAGSTYTVFDMQGRVIKTGRVKTENFTLAVPRSGTYLVRLNSEIRPVTIK